MVRAAEQGLNVSKPWGETAHYDFAVEEGGHFVRVQVKSTMFKDRGDIRARCGDAGVRMWGTCLILWRHI